jgi:lipoprotein-anchoring transpeptidase ErfK/SrfK
MLATHTRHSPDLLTSCLLFVCASCFSLVVCSPADAAQKPAPAKKPAAKHAVAKKPAAPAFDEQALQTQVALDRAGFSPGEIDGRMGTSTKRALEALTKTGGTPDASTQALVPYKITDADAAGPFTPDQPEDMMEKAKLPALGYKNIEEALGERFHVSPALLKSLNPQAKFAAGEEIRVPNVTEFAPPAPAAPASAAAAPAAAPAPAPARGRQSEAAATPAPAPAAVTVTVTVRKSTSDLVVTDAEGKTVFYAPVTTGSEHDPLPIGDWKVNGVQKNPTFAYNPDLFWDADATHAKAKIPAGPNNPVGVVWVDISRPHYGLHGTPEPSTVGKTSSHGCVRLTNWDAQRLSTLVKPGTKVVFAE